MRPVARDSLSSSLARFAPPRPTATMTDIRIDSDDWSPGQRWQSRVSRGARAIWRGSWPKPFARWVSPCSGNESKTLHTTDTERESRAAARTYSVSAKAPAAGQSLMFNGHMDTSYSGKEPCARRRSRVPAGPVRPRGAALWSRHLEHEGRSRLLCRGVTRPGVQEPGRETGEETCPGIDGLLKEKKAFAQEKPSDDILDFYNLGAAQKTERYEITVYENLIEMAHALGQSAIVAQLEANLQEEEAALQSEVLGGRHQQERTDHSRGEERALAMARRRQHCASALRAALRVATCHTRTVCQLSPWGACWRRRRLALTGAWASGAYRLKKDHQRSTPRPLRPLSCFFSS